MAGCLIAVAPGIGRAQAQDSRSQDLPAFNSSPTWTGFYIGAGFGGGATESHVTSTGSTGLNVDSAGG